MRKNSFADDLFVAETQKMETSENSWRLLAAVSPQESRTSQWRKCPDGNMRIARSY